ncbi:MAG: hypothetical protein QF793_04190 [Candidatus Peribacteraceae bacterium]|jgi:hypothetical protein|nr:hypothetical protein [Candidatus Peribacteraceae bacterium]|tara:strand:- start:2553 stop:2912 length:360 start_codon:yes stop_codon:yes gene_type:complete
MKPRKSPDKDLELPDLYRGVVLRSIRGKEISRAEYGTSDDFADLSDDQIKFLASKGGLKHMSPVDLFSEISDPRFINPKTETLFKERTILPGKNPGENISTATKLTRWALGLLPSKRKL